MGLKEEESEDTVFTDADLKAKAEAAFLGTEQKIDKIFDNVKPLVLNLQKLPGSDEPEPVEANSTKVGPNVVTAGEVGKVFEAQAAVRGGATDSAVTRGMVDNIVSAKEMMLTAKRKIGKLEKIVNDDSLNVPVPKKLVVAAKKEAKKEADVAGKKKGKEEGEKLGKAKEQVATKKAEKTAEKKVQVAKKKEAEIQEQE